MAVPPIQRSPKAAAAGPSAGVHAPWLLDIVLGLLIVAALPLAIIAIPNTISVVSDLLPGDIDRVGLVRAHGLALPAMMLTVPLAAVALRRTRVAYILVGGLALLAVADAAGGFAGSTLMVGMLRVLHGIGAGVLISATLVAAWERPPLLRAIWTGMLGVSLLAAQALALWPLDGVSRWQITLQPYPLLTGIALGLAAAYLLVWLLQGESATPTPRAKERSRLLLATVPAAGIAVLAISTASQDWEPSLVVLVAVLSIAALLALATIGTSESRTLSYTFVAVGVVLLPSVAQVTYVEMGGLGGPGLKGLWAPFGVAALLAVGAAVGVALFGGAASPWLSSAGLLMIVLGLCAVRLMVPAEEGAVLVVPFTLLAVGAAVALTTALRQAGVGAALFGLALCFPGVLAGYLLGTGVQVMMLRGRTAAQALVDGFVAALHTWALIGGFLVVAVIVLAALLARRSVVTAVAGTTEAVSVATPVEAAEPVATEESVDGGESRAEAERKPGGGAVQTGGDGARATSAVATMAAEEAPARTPTVSEDDGEQGAGDRGGAGHDAADDRGDGHDVADRHNGELGAADRHDGGHDAVDDRDGGHGAGEGREAGLRADDGSAADESAGTEADTAGPVTSETVKDPQEPERSATADDAAATGQDAAATGHESTTEQDSATEQDHATSQGAGSASASEVGPASEGGRVLGGERGSGDGEGPAGDGNLAGLDEEDRPTGEIPRIILPMPVNGDSPGTADPAKASSDGDGPPAVPPPTQSPEDTDTP